MCRIANFFLAGSNIGKNYLHPHRRSTVVGHVLTKPVVEAFAATAGIDVETRDISLAGRILSQFSDYLTEEQRVDDALAELGKLAQTPEANIIKLPNISASVPQMKAAIAELQESRVPRCPHYPDSPAPMKRGCSRALRRREGFRS